MRRLLSINFMLSLYALTQVVIRPSKKKNMFHVRVFEKEEEEGAFYFLFFIFQDGRHLTFSTVCGAFSVHYYEFKHKDNKDWTYLQCFNNIFTVFIDIEMYKAPWFNSILFAPLLYTALGEAGMYLSDSFMLPVLLKIKYQVKSFLQIVTLKKSVKSYSWNLYIHKLLKTKSIPTSHMQYTKSFLIFWFAWI